MSGQIRKFKEEITLLRKALYLGKIKGRWLAVLFSLLVLQGSHSFATVTFDVGISAAPAMINHYGEWKNVQLRLIASEVGDEIQECVKPIPTNEVYHSYNFGIPFDHLVVQDLDDPNHTGYAVTTLGIVEYPASAEGFGTFTYNGFYTGCVTHDTTDPPMCGWDETPPGLCDSSLYHWDWRAYMDAYITLPNCGRWGIYYVVDNNNWRQFCPPGHPGPLISVRERTVMLTERCDIPCQTNCANMDTNLVAYIQNSPNVWAYAYTEVDMGQACPEDTVLEFGEATARFLGYYHPGTISGDNWLPTADPAHPDSIGLIFGFESNPSGATFDVKYHIWDMTMWKGACMNSPRYTDSIPNGLDHDPRTTGFMGNVTYRALSDSMNLRFPYWDFTVGRPTKYNYYVFDSTRYLGTSRSNPWPHPGDTVRTPPPDGYTDFPNRRPLFTTDLVAYFKTNAARDTLWLKPRDYAAHCLVTPEIGGGKDRRMRPYQSPVNYQRLWTISVPRDYDGYGEEGVNHGDNMADYWEQIEFGTTAVENIRPFDVSPIWNLGADKDHLPVGRGIDGDNFCNFAEYRGLMVRDSVFVIGGNAHPRHQRLDPKRKTVFVHVRGNMNSLGNDSVLAQMPGYIYKLLHPPYINSSDTLTEIYFTDSIRFSPIRTRIDGNDRIEQARFILAGRDINYNRAGAGLWYYGFGWPLTYPMSERDTIRAVTFWTWDRNSEPSHHRNPNGILGVTPAYLVFGDTLNGASIPNKTIRVLIQIDKFNSIREQVSAYRGGTTQWQHDFAKECKRTIAHEFGHSIGMLHPDTLVTSRTIMSRSICDTTSGFSIADSVYSDSSKTQFSIKRNIR